MFDGTGNNPGDKTLEDKFFEHEVSSDVFKVFLKCSKISCSFYGGSITVKEVILGTLFKASRESQVALTPLNRRSPKK